ncbi:hypothetical protein BGZ81_000292 [Podila clonocystis]|nr:hypothetical protein BGZ81_000292 [Podila clonocystis]
MKRAFKSFFGIKKKPDRANLVLPDYHDQRSRDTPPPPFNTRTIYSQQDIHPISISRGNTRPLSYPCISTTTNTDPRSLEDIKVYEERLQDLESRIAEVTEQLSHNIRFHNKAREQEYDRPDDEDEFLQNPIAQDDEVLLQRRKIKGKNREQSFRPPEPIPHPSSSRQGPRVPQKSAQRRSVHSSPDTPRHRESFVYAEQDSFFDPDDYDSHITDTYHLLPNGLKYVHDKKHDKDKQSKSTRKPVKRNANSYVSYDNNASSSKNPSRPRGYPSSSAINKAVNDTHPSKDQVHSDTTSTKPTSTMKTSAPWQPHVVCPSQAVTAVSSTGSLFADHTSPPPPSKSRLSMMFGDRRDTRRSSLPWMSQDHTSYATTDSSHSPVRVATTPTKTPIQSHGAGVDLDHSTMDNTKVLSTQVKTARHQPPFHESHSVHSNHAKIELSKLEDDDIQQAHHVIHPYRATGPDTGQIHQSSMIMEPRPVLSSRISSALPSSPRTGFVAPSSPPQRLRSPIAIAASPGSNLLLSTSPISTVSSEQGTKRFSSATSRGTARRIIYSAELEQGLPKGHIARESNYEVVDYRGLDGRLSPASPRSSVVMSSPSFVSQLVVSQGLSTEHEDVESPATIVVRPGNGASAQISIRANDSSFAAGMKGKGRYTTSCSSSALSRISKRRAMPRRKRGSKGSRKRSQSIGEAIVQMTSTVFAARIRAQIHAFLFKDSPRRMNHRKRLPNAHRQAYQGDESQDSEIENSMSKVSSDTFTEEEEEEDDEGEDEDEGEEEKEEEGSIRSRRMSAPPRLGLLSSSPLPSSRAREFLQPARPRSLYAMLRRISPSRYEQEELDLPFIMAPLYHSIAEPCNTALADGRFPLEMTEDKEEDQDQDQDEEEVEPASVLCHNASQRERQLHEDDNLENCIVTSLAPPSCPISPVLINGLTCEELLHSIRFESDREGSPGFYGPAEYQRDEDHRREEEERAQEALKRKKQGRQEARKRSVSEASEVVAKVGRALSLAALTTWHTTAMLASRTVRTPIAATRTHAAGSTTMATTSCSVAEEEEERPKEGSI